LFVSAFLRARDSVTHRAGRGHFWNNWLVRNWAPRQDRNLPVFEQRRQVLKACGFNLQRAKFDLTVPSAARQWAGGIVSGEAIHLSPNASSPLKEWPLKKWVEFAQLLLQARPKLTLVATGGPGAREQEKLQQLTKGVSSDHLKIPPPGTTIPELAALLSACHVNVGGDSGVLHLAAALGVKTVAIFREYSGTREWLPQGTRHRHLIAPCDCADSANPPCAPRAEARCLAGISPEQVARLVNELADAN
jgi:ADP-heptose:LPS heptosyltransferase